MSIDIGNSETLLTSNTSPYKFAGMKKDTLADRLNLAMERTGMTQGALAKASGVAQPTIWRLASGNAKGSTRIVDIANSLGVRPEWLSSGDGEMNDEGMPTPTPGYSTIRNSKLKVAVWEDMEDSQKDDFVEIPLLDVKLSAGPGCEVVEENPEFTLAFRKHYLKSRNIPEQHARLVRINGRSMEPMLNDGDIVGVNMKDVDIRDGKTYAICQSDLLRVKILIATPDSVIIRSINREEYPDEVISREQFHDNVRIIGKVFWSAHSW